MSSHSFIRSVHSFVLIHFFILSLFHSFIRSFFHSKIICPLIVWMWGYKLDMLHIMSQLLYFISPIQLYIYNHHHKHILVFFEGEMTWVSFWKTFPSWWIQPICKNIRQNGSFPLGFGVKIKNIWNSHLAIPCCYKPSCQVILFQRDPRCYTITWYAIHHGKAPGDFQRVSRETAFNGGEFTTWTLIFDGSNFCLNYNFLYLLCMISILSYMH